MVESRVGAERVLLACILTWISTWGRVSMQPPPPNPQIEGAQIEAFITSQIRHHNLPGLALAVVQGNEILHLQGYGEARAGAPVTERTQFFLASLSKSFTALAVLQLVEAGAVGLDQPVQRYLPELALRDAEAAAGLRVRHLLNHTSGLGDWSFTELRLSQARTPVERLQELQGARLLSPPGESYAYTNPNYEILARLVEVASGQDFSAYLAEHVFGPLGMEDTFHANHTSEALLRAGSPAQGHVHAYGVPIALEELNGYIGGSAGVISTARDMASYLLFQIRPGQPGVPTLLSPELLALARTPPSGIDTQYGMGWVVREQDGQRILEHNGILSVFYAELMLLPDLEAGFVLLYPANSLAATAIAYTQNKAGLLQLLTGRAPASGGFSLVHWGLAAGALTAASLLLSVFGQLRAGKPAARPRRLWQTLLALLWNLLPAALLAALPALASLGSGRVFGYAALGRAMPEVFLWLGTLAVSGLLHAARRISGLRDW